MCSRKGMVKILIRWDKKSSLFFVNYLASTKITSTGDHNQGSCRTPGCGHQAILKPLSQPFIESPCNCFLTTLITTAKETITIAALEMAFFLHVINLWFMLYVHSYKLLGWESKCLESRNIGGVEKTMKNNLSRNIITMFTVHCFPASIHALHTEDFLLFEPSPHS